MAVSLVTHLNHSDFQSLGDPLRILQSFDYTFNDQMEFSSTASNNQENSTQYRNYATGSNNTHNTNPSTNYQGYDQVVDFVDSPPNSKDAWSDEYPKAGMQGPTILDVQSIHPINPNRKRRVDWDSLNISSNGANTPQTDNKLQNFGTKDREKKKPTGRGSWADDIDFDLNGEFSNNGYLHNEAFLSALTVLKQEIPSPNGDVRKSSRSPHSGKAILIDNQNQHQDKPHHTGGSNSPNNDTHGNNSGQNQTPPTETTNRQNSQSVPEQQPSPGGTNTISGLQQILQQQQPPSFENTSARNSPNHSETVIAKGDTSSDDFKFQYVLAAATSIATKSNEDTLTYLNQGQSYEIKLKKLGDLSQYRGKILKSIIKICFHERRLQYMEREQMQQWQASRPGERIIEVDVPLSYGLCHVSQPLNPSLLNTVEVLWDPMKEVGVYIKVNCISTEFTPKKHGGEKGVPFRIQIETYLDNNTTDNLSKPIHAAACQIKVFKLKGADRKHKQDREKIQKRPLSEQEKYQPSYDCTILNDIPPDSILPQGCYSPEYIKPTVSPLMPNSPVHMPKYDGIISFANNPSPIAINSVTSTNANNYKIMDQNLVSPQQVDMDEYSAAITKDSTPTQVAQWMAYHRLNPYVATFAHFSGSDILRMSKEDLIQICGLADGIRMFNTLHAKAIAPRLTIYVSLDGSSYHAIYLVSNTTKELVQKLSKLPGFYEHLSNNGNTDGNGYPPWGMHSKYSGSGSNLHDILKLAVYVNGPSGIHVLITDEVLNNIKDDSLFALEVQNGKVLMKAVYKNENN